MVFYYLREFSIENGFNKLSIEERLILSALLTRKLNNDDRELVEIIMNFNGNIEYTNYTAWDNYKIFDNIITNFLAQAKGHISDYVIKYAEDRSMLHYISINYDDLNITHKSNFCNIACKAFILGCANHSCNDNNDWFTFNIIKWQKFAMTHKKRTLEDIDKFMKNFNISYSVNGNKIIINNKKKQIKNIESTSVNEEKHIVKEEIPTIPVNNNEELDEYTSVKELIIDLKDGLKTDVKTFNPEFIDKINKAIQIEGKTYLTEIKDNTLSETNKTTLIRKFNDKFFNINEYIKNNCNNLLKVINRQNKGDDWQQVKDNARIEQQNLKIQISNALNKFYTYLEDKNCSQINEYTFVIFAWIYLNHQALFKSI